MMNIASEPVACRRQSEVFPGFNKERVPTELERASKPTSSSVTMRIYDISFDANSSCSVLNLVRAGLAT
jgi:hypothetical protein